MPNESIEDSGFLAMYGLGLCRGSPVPLLALGRGLVVGFAAHVAGLLSVDRVGLSWWAVTCGPNV